MHWIRLLVVTLLFAYSAYTSGEVLTLNQTNFKATIDSNTYVIVNFFAPWCRYSRELLPEYAKLANILNGEMVVASVDISEEAALSNEEHITHVPFVKFWKNGNLVSAYSGPRRADSLALWARSLTTEIPELTTELLAQADAEKKAVLVGFYKVDPNPEISMNSNGVDEHTVIFLDILNELDGLPVIFSTSDENKRAWAEDWGASGDRYPTLGLLYWNTAKSDVKVNIRMWNEEYELTASAVKQWVNLCLSKEGCSPWRKSQKLPSQGDVSPLTTIVGYNFEEIVLDRSKDVLVFFSDQNFNPVEPTIPRHSSYANQHSESHSIGSNLEPKTKPPHGVASSQPTSTLTPKPQPVIMEVANRLSSVPTLVVGYINVRKNGFPDYIRERLPRLHVYALFPANDKENFLIYEGENIAEDIIEFVATNAFLPFEIPKKPDNPNALTPQANNDGENTDDEESGYLLVCKWSKILNTLLRWLGLFWVKL